MLATPIPMAASPSLRDVRGRLLTVVLQGGRGVSRRAGRGGLGERKQYGSGTSWSAGLRLLKWHPVRLSCERGQ